MKLSELKYITQDIIDKGSINVTTPEMLEESRRYNMDAVTNNAKRRRMTLATGIWLVIQIPLSAIFAALYLILKTVEDTSLVKLGQYEGIASAARVAALIIGLLAYIGFFCYYIIFRFHREPLTMFLCSSPLLLTTLPCWFIIIVNLIVGSLYVKRESMFSEEAGYPAFVRLAVTTLDSDAKSVHDMTYDSIRERTKHMRGDDGEML